ncbi:MAG: RraA family protein [Pseudomonadota bacterium]
MTDITTEDLARLADWDTPTICNGLELINPAWRLSGYTVQPFACVRPEAKPMVGYARTATIRAGSVPSRSAEEMRDARLAYYDYIDRGPKPSITVIQDLDSEPGVGAWWGEVNSTIHAGLGSLGTITNGSIRDLADFAPGFQGLAGKIGPSHAHVRVTGHGGTIEVHGMTVRDGDIVHADCHGAVVVPVSAVRELPDVIGLIARREAVMLEAASKPGFTSDALRAAMAEAAKIT